MAFRKDPSMRWLFAGLLAAVVGTGVYVGSAVVSLGGLVDAARAGDGAAVLARTDTDRLRHSLVDQIVAAYLKQIGANRPVKPLERLAANTYGASIADAMIAKMLTEENLTRILKSGAIAADGAPPATMRSLTDLDTSRLADLLGRLTPVKLVEFSVRLGTDNAEGISMHFAGDGWKLSGIQLPTAAVQRLAQSLSESRGRKG
jgi:hypothetical protein